MKRTLDISRLKHYVRVALYAFREDAKVFKASKPNAMMTSEALARMYSEFNRYAHDAEEMLNSLEEGYQVTLEVEEE